MTKNKPTIGLIPVGVHWMKRKVCTKELSPKVFLVYRKGELPREFSSKGETKKYIMKEALNKVFGKQKPEAGKLLPAGLMASMLSRAVANFRVIGICDEAEIYYRVQVSEEPTIAPQPGSKKADNRNSRKRKPKT